MQWTVRLLAWLLAACCCGAWADPKVVKLGTSASLMDSAWLANRKTSGLRLLGQDPERLGNTYALMTISKAKLPQLNHAGAAVLVRWLTSDKGKAAVRSRVIDGEPLYTLVAR